ncbi:CUB and sushi domain-containing protein 2, partial [Armadillidium nasatum]
TSGCSQPVEIINGYYIELFESSDSFYPLGARLQFICHSGYLLKGPDMFICDETGKWTPENQPECVLSPQILNSKKCSVPPDIWGSNRKLIRGIVGADSAVHGTMVEYRCRPGYRNVVAPCVAHTLTCSRGEWRGTSPQCEEFKTCLPPPNIANGFIYEVSSSYPLKSQVYYSCERGYRLLGPSVLTCEDNGCWIPGMAPICQLNPRTPGENENRAQFSIHTLLVAAISGIIAVLFLLVALLLYHRAVSPKLVRLRSSGSGNELQPRVAPPTLPPVGAQAQTHIPTEHDPDRVALIAFPDELLQNNQGVPPTYEEAVRQRPALFDHMTNMGRYGPPHNHRNRNHRVVVSGVRRPRHRDNPDNISYQSIGSARQSSGTSRSMSVRSWSACDSLGSSDTVAISDSTNVTVDTMSSGATSGAGSQAPSCRGLAGSRASFDTSSLNNNEDAPLLEEAEGEELRSEDQYSLSSTRGDSDSLKDNISSNRSVSLQE